METESTAGGPTSPLTEELRNQLVEEHLYLVRAIARKILVGLPSHVDLEELEGVGRLGLLEASRRFDPSRGVLFKTFVYYRIRGAILDSIRKSVWFTGTPEPGVTMQAGIHDLQEEEFLEGGYGDDGGDLEHMIGRARGMVGSAVIARLIAPGPSPLEERAMKRVRELLLGQIRKLEEKERRLVEAYYFENQTLEEAGAMLGLSKSWASRLHARALRRLGELCREVGITSPD